MSHPIPIVFTRQPPDCEGLWIRKRVLRSGIPAFAVFWCRKDHHWGLTLTGDDGYWNYAKDEHEEGDEWAGPLQPTNETNDD